MRLICLLLVQSLFLYGGVRIVPAKEFPEPETVQINIVFPKSEEAVKGNPVYMQVRVRGYSLGSESIYSGKQPAAISPLGQTLHVIVDGRPYFPYNGPSFDPFDEDGDFYQSSFKFRLPYSLEKGMHTVRVFACRSYGESLKGDQVFDAKAFYVGKEEKNYPSHLNMPYLTYNEPSNQFDLRESNPILLDFLLNNCELSKDGYKVKVSIDERPSLFLVEWRPYYIYGLAKGKHTIRLTLVDSKNREVFGPFNDVERIIYVR